MAMANDTDITSVTTIPTRHRHESSMWGIVGGLALWCYQCGAFRPNAPGAKWQKPSGIGGANPAMTKGVK
jgi:hypothetical protein